MTNRLLNNKKYANANLNQQLVTKRRRRRREVHNMAKVGACHVAYEQQHCVYIYIQVQESKSMFVNVFN